MDKFCVYLFNFTTTRNLRLSMKRNVPENPVALEVLAPLWNSNTRPGPDE